MTTPPLPTLLRQVTRLAALAGMGLLAYTAANEIRSPVAARHGERPNPWRGIPGCLVLKNALTGAVSYWPLAQGMELGCPEGATPATGHAAPAHAQSLGNALYPLIAPPPNAYAIEPPDLPDSPEAPRMVNISGYLLAKSADVTLTLDPVATRQANTLASCLTSSNVADCEAVKLDPRRFAHLHEGAGARMVALVDMRIDDGAIEAMASAHSLCFGQMLAQLALSPAAGCPQMPRQYQLANAWRGENHALYNQAMWASLVKPALALALLRGGVIQTDADKAWLTQALKTSDTPAFMDRIFCRSAGFAKACKPLRQLQSAGIDLGYTTDVFVPRERGLLDLLEGSAGQLTPPSPHWLERATKDVQNPWQPVGTQMPQLALLQDCAKRKWSECRGEHLAELASHAWGQSDGKATPLAAAAAFAALGSAANGSAAEYAANSHGMAPKPTLLAGKDAWRMAHVEPDFAKVIVHGMAQTHTSGGTAHSACVAVWGSTVACNNNTMLAGKTGTPTMPHDAFTLARRKTHCDDVAKRLDAARQTQTRPAARDSVENARCSYAPYKWYVALAKDSGEPGAPWSRVIAVQIERNWSTGADGRVDAAFDKGINVAAFTAMHYLRLRQAHPKEPT